MAALNAARGERADAAEPGLAVLTLNSGSSSLKFGLYRTEGSHSEALLSGRYEMESASGQREALSDIASRIAAPGLPIPDAVAHRVVHSGPMLQAHCRVDDAVLAQIEAAAVFAPLHAPAALAVLRDARTRFPGAVQVACFDTVFHAGLPAVARTLAVPLEWRERGIRRYGFHGLSCESIVHQLADRLPARLVIAHLGQGASVTAVRDGRSIDTSMGLTPTGGAMMGTRSGDLDPGLVVWLMREMRLDAAQLEDIVNHRCGLLGVSGSTSDLRHLHEAARLQPAARLAIEMFCYGIRKQIAAMAAALGGVDMLAFTGGIGENDAEVRRSICEGLAWLGDFDVRVLPSDEEERLAHHAAATYRGRADA